MDFYDDVLREIVLAMGAALFVANAFALYRRQTDAKVAAQRTVARRRPGSPVRGYGRDETVHDLPQAPVARSVFYMLVGLVVAVWALASLTSG